jgi:hypothetical protein
MWNCIRAVVDKAFDKFLEAMSDIRIFNIIIPRFPGERKISISLSERKTAFLCVLKEFPYKNKII